MTWIVAKIKWIMLVSGVLTCAAFYAAVMPREALRFLFDKSLSGGLAEILVRDWAVMVGLVGVMLIYGAFEPQVRTLVLTVAGLSKLIFMGLVVGFSRRSFEEYAGIAIAVDMVMVALFVTFLLGFRHLSTRRVEKPSAMKQQPMPPTPRPEATVRIPSPHPAPHPHAPTPAPRPPAVKTP